jgi:hypothetical protein
VTLTFADIETHVQGGKTAAEIAAILAADFRHVRDVMATSSDPADNDLLDVFGTYGLLRIKANATWGGTLVDAVAAADNELLTAGFERLLMNLQITNRPVRCGADSNIGYLVTALTGIAQQAVPDQAAAIAADMQALTGGRRFAGVTEADVQTLLDENERDEIVATTLGTIQAAHDTAGQRLNNATASLSAEHIDGLTLEQLQARCAAVAASADGLVGG